MRLDHVRNLTLSYFFLDAELNDFLTVCVPRLQRLTLICCNADSGDETDVEDVPTWGVFLMALKDSTQSLLSLTFKHRYDDIEMLYYEDDRLQRHDEIRAALDEMKVINGEQSILSDEEWQKRKRPLPYVTLSDKYGHIIECEELNAKRYLSGEDHKALLELNDTMVGRGGEGVLCLPAQIESSESVLQLLHEPAQVA